MRTSRAAPPKGEPCSSTRGVIRPRPRSSPPTAANTGREPERVSAVSWNPSSPWLFRCTRPARFRASRPASRPGSPSCTARGPRLAARLIVWLWALARKASSLRSNRALPLLQSITSLKPASTAQPRSASTAPLTFSPIAAACSFRFTATWELSSMVSRKLRLIPSAPTTSCRAWGSTPGRVGSHCCLR